MRPDVGPVGMPPEWYVAFWEGAEKHWWWPICRPGFRHVAAFGYSAEHRVWLVYDVTLRRTLIQVLDSNQMDAWVTALPDNNCIVAFQPAAEPDPPLNRLGFWCTTAIAHLVGVRSRALRPEALYRDLIAQGARPAFQGEQA